MASLPQSLSEPLPRVPARTVLLSIAGLWLCYFVLASARGLVVGLEMHWPLLLRRLVVTAGSMAVTAAIWPLLRLLDPARLWTKIGAVLLIALPASLLLAAINQWVFSDIESQVVTKIGEREGLRIRRDEAGNLLVDPLNRGQATPAPAPAAGELPVGPASDGAESEDLIGPAGVTISRETRDETRWQQLTDVALGRYFLLLAWAALYYALVNSESARLAERREGEYRRAAKASELRSLRYQVNPHFLFNTLNSLSALVMTGKSDAAERMIQTLSTFYRRSLAGDPTGDLPLSEEIDLQRLYLEIEAVRFPERLIARFDIPADLEAALVPGMILQPLVENSVKYAVARSRLPVTVTIAARAEADRLAIAVSDDGVGEAGPGTAGCGIGLSNVRDRLAARFGGDGRLESGPVAGGYRTVIRLPLVKDHG
ncbi:MAG: histidine kinase [Sphingomonadales bacterium]|nr:histidine kinase [Sphingomonadales bacterium]